jgi:UDP-N-acetylmuramate: L-alanyl-gamma-D-glutamyl-meso-diaminopimelate ligase
MSTQLQAWYSLIMALTLHNLPRPDLVIGNAVARQLKWWRRSKLHPSDRFAGFAPISIQDRHGVVTGTHGKSTTTALIAWLLQHAGYEPGFVGAGWHIDGTLVWGRPHFVVEGMNTCAISTKAQNSALPSTHRGPDVPGSHRHLP